MGLILDSSLLIAGERRGERVWDILDRVIASQGNAQTALSVVTAVELIHGIYRAKSVADANRRRSFVEELCQAIPVEPVTLDIARIAGRIEGEQAAKGMVIALPDLLIGATVLDLGFSVATLNVRHFQSIPGLFVVQL